LDISRLVPTTGPPDLSDPPRQGRCKNVCCEKRADLLVILDLKSGLLRGLHYLKSISSVRGEGWVRIFWREDSSGIRAKTAPREAAAYCQFSKWVS